MYQVSVRLTQEMWSPVCSCAMGFCIVLAGVSEEDLDYAEGLLDWKLPAELRLLYLSLIHI